MLLALHNKYQISLLGFLQFLPDLLAQNRIFWGRRGGIFVCDMPVSCMICLKAIQGLGGGPICFLLLLIHTLNILFYEFDSNASINFLTFKCHTQKNGTDLRRSPLGSTASITGTIKGFLYYQTDSQVSIKWFGKIYQHLPKKNLLCSNV